MITKVKTLFRLALLSLLVFVAARSRAQENTLPYFRFTKPSPRNELMNYYGSNYSERFNFRSTSFSLGKFDQTTIMNQSFQSTFPPFNISRLPSGSFKLYVPSSDYTYQYFYRDTPTSELLRPRVTGNFDLKTPENKLNFVLFVTGQALQAITIGHQQRQY